MSILVYIYAIGALLVAVRFGWHMLFRLDGYDWHFNKLQIWTFILSSLLWPLTAFRLKLLLDPRALFTDEYGMAARSRERNKLWETPPPCGDVVLYTQGHARFGQTTSGEFLFSASDVESVLVQKLRENPHLASDDEGAILKWVRNRQARHGSTPVPSVWLKFQYVADDLIRAGKGQVRCLQCVETFPTGELIPKDDRGLPGWNFDRLKCPRGHPLLVVEGAHILVRRKPQGAARED